MTARGRIIGRLVTIGVVAGVMTPLAWVAPPAAVAATPGTVWTWGTNDFGQLGNGTTSTTPSGPAEVAGLADVVQLEGGREHVVALTLSGQVFTWGSNENGQLGLGDTANRSSPVQVGTATTWSALSGGNATTCGVRTDTTVWCWGGDVYGELAQADVGPALLIPTQVPNVAARMLASATDGDTVLALL
jgi:alpha-tubulin suppressor-like RCC1 family protein